MNTAQPALADESGAMNAEALQARIDTDSHWLHGAGVCRVGLLAANGMPWVIADRALEQSGALNVPLPHHFSAEQLSHAINDAGLDALLTDDASLCRELATGFTATNAAPGSGLRLLRRQGNFDVPSLPTGTQKITYTSGSTAEPKGCLSDGRQHGPCCCVAGAVDAASRQPSSHGFVAAGNAAGKPCRSLRPAARGCDLCGAFG